MAAPQSREEDRMLRMSNGDNAAATTPFRHYTCDHPFDGRAIMGASCELAYFFPRECLWAKSARGFGQHKGAMIANSTENYRLMIEHIAYVASLMGLAQNEGGGENQFLTWTRVPQSDLEPNSYAGFLMRVVYQVPMSEPLKHIDEHFAHCDRIRRKTIEKGRERNGIGPKHVYRNFTIDKYVKMAQFYTTVDIANRSLAYNELTKIDNPWNPFNIFTLKRACTMMRNYDAHPEFTKAANLWDSGRVMFPGEGNFTWSIPPSEFNPMSLNDYYFPHQDREIDVNNIEYRNFMRAGGMRADAPDDDRGMADMDINSEADDNDPDAAVDTASNKRKRYQRIATSAEIDSQLTLETFKERVKTIMNRARKEAGDDEQLYFRLRVEAQKECLDIFQREVFTDDDTVDCGDALKSVAKFFDEFLQKNDNCCMPLPKATSNLSRFADLQSSDTCALESVWAINTAHHEVKSLRLAMMHVYFYSPFQPHTCCAGQPGTGKSNGFQVNDARLIKGTSRDIGVETSKAKNTPGKKSDLMIEIYEDITPAQMGIQPGNGNQTNSTSNTDQEALLKYRLTKGRIKGMYKSVINGVHAMVEIDSFCNTVMIVGMNAALSSVPDSIRDRFNNIQFQIRNREDGLGNNQMLGKYMLAGDTSLSAIKATLVQRDRRNQCFHAMIQILCWAGVFAMPDMTVPVIIWSHTLTRAKEKGLLDTNNIRHFERLKMICETAVIEDAIDRVLDSELSPLNVKPDGSPVESHRDPKRKWHMHDLLHFEKHLYANTEHATFALGMLQHQYENPTIVSVEKYFKTVLLKDKISRGLIGRHDNDPMVYAQLQYYYVVPISQAMTGSSSGSSHHDSKSDNHLLHNFAKYVHRHMIPKPQLHDVTFAIETLCALEIEVDDRARAGEKIKIPSIAFSKDGEAMIAVAMMANFVKDRLLNCLKQVLCHSNTHPKNILYGRTREDCPYVWQAISIQPCPTTKLSMQSPTYMTGPVKGMTRNLVAGVCHASSDDASKLITTDEVEAGEFDTKFSETSHKMVDVDLDDFASFVHAQRLGLRYFPESPDAPGGSTAPHVLTDRIRSLVDESSLLLYPSCFKETSRGIFRSEILKDKRENPNSYSLRHSSVRKRKSESKLDQGEEGAAPGELRPIQIQFDADEAGSAGEQFADNPPAPGVEFCDDNDINNDGDDDDDDTGNDMQTSQEVNRNPRIKSFIAHGDELNADDFAALDEQQMRRPVVPRDSPRIQDVIRMSAMGSSNAAAAASAASRHPGQQHAAAYSAFVDHKSDDATDYEMQ